MLKIFSNKTAPSQPLEDSEEMHLWFSIPNLIQNAQEALNGGEFAKFIDIMDELSWRSKHFATRYRKLITEKLKALVR